MIVEDELFHLLSTKGFIRYYNCVWSFKPTESFNIDFNNYNEFINQLMEKNNDVKSIKIYFKNIYIIILSKFNDYISTSLLLVLKL